MDISLVLGFALACVVLNLVPGPGMMFTIARGMTGGRRSGVVAALGMASGTVVHTLAAALGLSAVLAVAPAALDVVRIVGAAVLLYLAFGALRSAAHTGTPPPDVAAPRSRTYLSAVLTNLANPKVVLFFLAFVPQFITGGGWPTGVQILLLGALLTAIGLVMDSAVGIAAGTCSTLLRRRPSIQRWLQRVSATIFAGLAVRMLATDPR